MLKNLFIKDYVLFEHVNLSFNAGFNALTGDTGAGKSLIIDALGYLTGNRLNTNIVRKGSDKALIEGVFVFNNQHTQETLRDAGFDFDDDVIVSREITKDGKSTSRINHRIVTLGFVKDLFNHELDIHGQRDTQYLLDKKTHIQLLDEYAQHDALKNEVSSAYKTYYQSKKAYNDHLNNTYNEDEVAFYKTQLQEIVAAEIDENEYNTLLERKKMIDSYEDIFNDLNSLRTTLNEHNGAVDNLYTANQSADNLTKYEEYRDLSERINSVYLEIVDINNELAGYLSGLEFDEFELNKIEERLFVINHLIRKHGGTFESLQHKQEEMQQIVQGFEEREYVLSNLKQTMDDAYYVFETQALKLRKHRQQQCGSLEQEVINNLKDLELEHAIFKVSLTPTDASQTGLDEVEFLISMNPGEDLKPMSLVASGGELSRLMLGLKVIFSRLYGVSTIIFDEIDTGVSGSIASAIGLKMSELSKDLQVFSVTHLAQVAACSDYQYYVAKAASDDLTSTNIEHVTGDKQIEHLAYLATGSTSKASLNAAKELYQKSQAQIKDLV